MMFKMNTYLAVLLLTLGPCVMGCTTGRLRLTGSSSGELQICKSGVWRAVSSDDWGHLDSAVACKQLGYDGGYTNSTWSSSNTLAVDPVEYYCTGRETNLQHCEKSTISWISGTNYVASIVCVRRNASDLCNSGDIRLWGGEKEYEGNVEICTNRRVWSAVCDTFWNTADAVVLCRQLNYSKSIAVAYTHSAFGRRAQPTEYGGLDCRGTESTLQSCTMSRSFVRYCYSRLTYCHQGRHAGVKCIPREAPVCENGEIKLVGGYSENNGYAEICIDGAWTGICQTSSPDMSMLICRQMGYSRYTRIDPTFFPTNTSAAQVYVSSWYLYPCVHGSSKLLGCISNNSVYGIYYVQPTCTPHATVCCPNDTEECSLRVTPPTDYVVHFTLTFGEATRSLLMSRSDDCISALEGDIEQRAKDSISKECDCQFDKSTLEEGYFCIGETIMYRGKVSGKNKDDANRLAVHLKTSFDKKPEIYFSKAGLFLNVTLDITYLV